MMFHISWNDVPYKLEQGSSLEIPRQKMIHWLSTTHFLVCKSNLPQPFSICSRLIGNPFLSPLFRQHNKATFIKMRGDKYMPASEQSHIRIK